MSKSFSRFFKFNKGRRSDKDSFMSPRGADSQLIVERGTTASTVSSTPSTSDNEDTISSNTPGPQYFTSARNFKLKDVVFQNVRGDFNQYTGVDPDLIELSGLAYAYDVSYNSGKQCLPDTRTEVIDEIKEWAHNLDPETPPVLWLHGAAGTGKSAIAHTIALEFDRNDELGSCFAFDSAYLSERRHHDMLFSTIARDLAARDEKFKRTLAYAVRERAWLKSTRDLAQQWANYLVKPAVHLSAAGPILIVIEALDESGDPSSRSKLLSIIANQVTELPSNIRILLTSRPWDDISEALGNSPHVLSMDLNMVPKSLIDRDIAAYISAQLSQIDNIFFDESRIYLLTELSEGLFQWAYVVCELIKGAGKISDPKKQFMKVIDSSSARTLSKLDQLYDTVLRTIIPDDDKDGRVLFCSVMAQILAMFEPLSLHGLTTMRSSFPPGTVDANDVSLVVKHMGSLLSGTTDPSVPIRPLHSSFHDYLTDSSRSKEFYIDKSLHLNDLAFATLEVLKTELRFNICQLETSYRLNSDIPNLAELTSRSISSALSYSCRYWEKHVKKSHSSVDVALKVYEFLRQQFLFWLEVLSLLKCVANAAPSLSSIIAWIADGEAYADLREFVTEAQHFVRMFGGMISQSAPHIYLSALPFTPESSVLYRQFAPAFPRALRLASGRAATWPACQRVLIGHTGWATCVALSSDGKRIFSGSWDRTIRIWDSETGETVTAPLTGHSSPITCMALSPDGKRIASGSFDRTIHIWNAVSGEAVGSPLGGQREGVTSVNYSPDGTCIVSGSRDHMIYIWNLADMGRETPSALVGHKNTVTSVAFSPDGKRIASGSEDKTVRIWSAETRGEIIPALNSHAASVNTVTYSPNARYLVSGSDDKTICLWNIEKDQVSLSASLQGHASGITSAMFSNDSRHIISGSLDDTIRMWDVATGQAIALFEGHKSWVKSVVLSADGKRLVSASKDNTIRIWNAETRCSSTRKTLGSTVTCLKYSADGKHIAGSRENDIYIWDAGTGKVIVGPLRWYTKRITCLEFSRDGKCLLSGSDDGIIRSWNTETGDEVVPPLTGHTSGVTCIAYSPNGKRIVSGSYDRTIRIWDAETGRSITTPLRGHSHGIFSIAFLPGDNEHVLSGSSDKTIRKWNIDKCQAAGVPFRGSWDSNSSITFIEFSSDGQWHIISCILGRMIHIWTGGTGEEMVMPLVGHTSWVRSITFSSNGKYMISGSDDKTIRLWNAETGEGVGLPLQGHTDEITSVALSPDGLHVASAARDNTIRIWEVSDMNEVGRKSHRTIIRGLPAMQLILFSSNPLHALHDAHVLFEDVGDGILTGNWNDSLTVQEDGWVLGPQGRLLFWVSHNQLPGFFTPRTKVLIGTVGTELDLSCFAHGRSWQSCRAT